MAVMAPERASELVVELRRGLDLDGTQNPAGPLFADGYREFEITMTGGGGHTGPHTNFSAWDTQFGVECCPM
jgi:hypothetical protein